MPIIDSPDFGHALVPIDSLTSSPRSSTGSTSVLEWNSYSDSEGFSVHSSDQEQYVQSSPATPDIPTFSPNPPSPKTSLPDDDQTFASFNSAAPVADSVTNTVTSDTFVDEYHNLLSALDQRLSLQHSVNQWQNHSYRETAGLDNRPESPSDLLDDGVHDKPHISSAPSPNRSLATDSSFSAVTAKPSLQSLFLAPSPPAPAPCPASPSAVSQSESISIAQYFQLKKAANVEEAEPVQAVQPQVDGQLRPISAASCLSYASSGQTRSAEAPLHQLWQDLTSKYDKSSNSTTACSPPTLPPRCSSSCPSWYQPFSWPGTSQMENNNAGPQTNVIEMLPPSPQGSDALETNLKSHAPSWPTWPILPAIPCQSEPVTLKPIKPIISPTINPQPWCGTSQTQPWGCGTSQMENNNAGFPIIRALSPSSQGSDTLKTNLNNHAPSWPTWPNLPDIPYLADPVTLKPIKPVIHNRPQPWVTNTSSLHGKNPGKSTSRPVPPSSRDQSSTPYPGSDLSRPSPWYRPWFYEPKIRDIGQASPESIDSVLPPPPSTPSVNCPTRPGSPRVECQLPYLRHQTPSNVPFVPLTPPLPPLNGANSTTQRTSRALPIPSISRTFGSHSQAPYTPRYTDSTLPRDMHISAAPPTPWGPTPRRLRFAPLPPTPSAGLPYTGAPGSTQPYTTPLYTAPLPPYPLYPMSYPCHAQAQAPAPQTHAPISTPYSSWRPGPTNFSPLWTPHHVFWFSDGSIVFRIENVGYKVHRHFFERHSTYFRDLLAYPTYSVTSPSPHTIHLADVKKVDFERLLLIFYPSSLATDGPELITVEEWTSILTLSDKWNFAELKTHATLQLSSLMSTIEKIVLSKKHNVGNPYWLLAAYRELCTRRYPLSLVEGEKLGLETVIKIWEVQHDLLTGNTWGRSVDNVIKERFGLL